MERNKVIFVILLSHFRRLKIKVEKRRMVEKRRKSLDRMRVFEIINK